MASVRALSIDAIVCFGKKTISTPLIGFCAERGISLVLLSEHGNFMARVEGPVSGNVLLRKRQYESLNDQDFSAAFVRNLLMAKQRNSKTVLLRSARSEETGDTALYDAAGRLSELAKALHDTESMDSMRGIEGAAASIYFSCFNRMLGVSCPFRFETRSRRPPKNEVKAALSFVYALLRREVTSALESVGLDPAAGYLHTLRPGRPSFSLDLMEELRGPMCDRFVLTLFRRKQLSATQFESYEEAVYLNEKGRRTVLSAWQKRLRKVSKLCERYGLRVQNSVFELLIDAAQLATLKAELAATIDHDHDSIRFYRLGSNYKNRIDAIGRTDLVQTGEPILL